MHYEITVFSGHMIGTILHSVDVLTILTFFITLLLAYIIWDNVVRVRTNIPGPTPWPIIGNLPSIIGTKNASETFLQMQKKYGDLVYLKFGKLPIVVVFGYKNVHQVLVDNGNKTKFRPRHLLHFLKTMFPKEAGVIFSNGQEWVDIRRFSMVALKDFDVGKQSIEEKIQDEVDFLMDLFSKQGKKPTDCSKMFPKATSNIILSIIFGSRSPAFVHEIQDNGDGIQCKRTDSVAPPASLHEIQDNGDGIQCKRTDSVLPSTSLPELNTKDPVNITSGVKRSFCSDHAYCTMTCNSFSELVTDNQNLDSDDDVDSEDGDIDNGVKSVLDAIKGVNLTPSSKYDFQSVLKSLTIDELPRINIFLEILNMLKEMKERCPDLLFELMNVSVKNPSVISIRNITSVIVAYSALMFSRNNKNSAFQRCTTLMAVAGNASDEFIRRLNQIGISLSCTSKLRILEKAGETSKNLLVEKLKTNPRMKITGDNLDMYIKTNHQRQDNDNKDIHWFASNAFLSRLDYSGLSSEKPNVPLGDISPEFFIPNEAEKSKLRDVKKVLIGRMIVDKKDFDWLEKKLPTHIPHRYSEYMSKKQEVFSLPIIFKNESKNEDCLDIMDAYERQLTEIFTLAHGNTDMLQKHGAVLGGDQLTRERLQNVKNIRFLALTPEGRFEHLNPIVIEHWHVKQDLLSKAYKALFRAESICTPGTLFHAKTILRRQDVTGNVKSNYKAHEDLFLLMVKALLHVAAEQIQVQDNEDRDSILSQLYSKVHGEEHDAEDQVMNYFINIIEWGLLIMNMNDTAKEGDFERLEINCKEGIGFLLSHSIFSKYFGELVNFLLLTKHLLSPDMSMRALEGAFINTKGGPGKNKEADLVQEHCIRNKKDLIRSLGANKTEKAVMRACGAADTCVGVGRTVDGCLGLPKLSVNHTKKSSVKDLEILVKCLKTVDPFKYHKGRTLKSFCNIRKHPER